MLINSIITRFLARKDILYHLYSLITIIRELVVNSLKANSKRVFFESKGYDMNDPAQYAKGMALFKDTIIGDFEFIKSDVLKSDRSIIFSVIPGEKGLSFSVKNSAPIHPAEQERINKRIAIAVQNENFGDIYTHLEDDSEGAGLGIALIIMFLKSMGVPTSSFRLKSDDTVTMASFEIPYYVHPKEIVTKVKTRILYEIKGLPTFPEHVIELLKMCSSVDSDIDVIAGKIKLDVALTSDVIKLANSAGFITLGKTDDINKAVVKIGLKNLHAVLLASNARKILEGRYTRFEEIWDHCGRVAFYSRAIARKYNMGDLAEHSYIAGLLHDIGKVILLAVDMNGVKEIAKIVKSRDIINSSIMEEISIGISHAEIGALLAEKWNFPEYMTAAIRHHHSPSLAPENSRDIIYSVYLANMICGIEKRNYYYHYIEDSVLERFDIENEIQFAKLHQFLLQEYKGQS
ncbi:MAG TPA: HDOD domain-containing protein [Spirochaetota bacterium]|nr:HDOD domain-containing protein [Spirochaetota bacterium]HPJ33344.1 HDOD domain-containing protein [Spirochaetota bacterium]